MTSGKQTFDYDGKIAGLYDLHETIGSGHFAVVKLARHVFTGEKVAVKVIDKNKLDPVSRAHLFQEVRCMKLVQHPHVVRLYEVIDTQTKLYLILELGDGGDMYDYIMKHDGGLDVDLARMYFRQIVEAISYCHTLHVVHRDLKPENVIFFEKLGVVKLTDFGFSNKYDPGTKLETSCGSLAYSAPEILLGDSYDAPAVDVWSLGVLLYMLVCGTPPFQEANDSETLTMIMDCKYHVPPHVPLDCKSLINKMLQRDPSRRATLHEIVNDSWLAGDADWNVGLPVMKDALVTTQHLSPEDQDAVIDRMVEGNIAPRHEIVKFLREDEYNHVTATYYLLAERVLSRRRQREFEAASASTGGGGTPGSASAGGGGLQQQPLTRQASMPGMMASAGSSAAYRSHRLDHLSLNVSDTPRELGAASDDISALAVSPPGPPSVLSLTGCTTLPPRARKHSLIQEEDEECDDSEGESGVSVFIGDGETFSRRDFYLEKSEAEVVNSSSGTFRMDKAAGGGSSSSRGGSGSSSPRRRAATTPAAATVTSVSLVQPTLPPASSRHLRTVCSSPQLLKPLSAAASGLRQIYEDGGEGTSASEGLADEDDDCPSLKWRPPRSADRRQTLPSPSTSRRLRLVRRKLQSDKKRAHSGSSDTSDTDDTDRRDAAQPGSGAVASCRRKDSTSSGDTDSAGPGAGGGTGTSAGLGSGSHCAAHPSSSSSSGPASETTRAGQAGQDSSCNCSDAPVQAPVGSDDDDAGPGLAVSRALSRSQEAWLPTCDQSAAAAEGVLPTFELQPPAAMARSVRRLPRDPSPPLPGRASPSPAAAVDGAAATSQAQVLLAAAAAAAAGGQSGGGCVGRLAPISGCSTPEPVKTPNGGFGGGGGGGGGRAACDCVGGSSPCSRSSSCSAVNLRQFASKIVESSVSRMSNFSLASHVSSLSAASSSKSSVAGMRCGGGIGGGSAAGATSGGDFSRSTPRLSRYGSKKFNKAKLIHVLAKEFSDLSETHSRTSVASLYLEDLGSSGMGMGASMAISCRAMDINDNSIATMPAAAAAAVHLDGKLSVSAGVLTKRKSDADCCSIM